MIRMERRAGVAKTGRKLSTGLLVTIKRNSSAWLLMLPTIILFVIFVWQPLISGVFLSFFETKGYDAVRFVGLKNYVDIISDSAFVSALLNSFSYTIWSFIIGFLLPIVTAVMINEMVHLKSFFKFAVYFPNMLPGVAASIMWYFMLDPGEGGLLNTLGAYLGLHPLGWLQDPHLTIPLIVVTLAWRSFGSSVIIYLASLQGVNQELYEVSALDGAGIWSRIRYITIPQIKSIIKLLVILQVIGAFQIMYEPLTMTDGGPNNASISLMLQAYFYAFRYFRADRSMAMGVIIFIILMIFSLIYFATKKENDVE